MKNWQIIIVALVIGAIGYNIGIYQANRTSTEALPAKLDENRTTVLKEVLKGLIVTYATGENVVAYDDYGIPRALFVPAPLSYLTQNTTTTPTTTTKK